MTDSELIPVRSILAELAPQGRSALLPALHAAQQIHGWIPEPVAAEVGRALAVPLADVFGVIDFYAMFSRQPVGRTVVRVCSAPVCALAGADALADALCRHLQIEPGEVSSDGAFTVEHAPCLGLCDHAPAVLVGDAALGHADTEQAAAMCAPNGAQTGELCRRRYSHSDEQLRPRSSDLPCRLPGARRLRRTQKGVIHDTRKLCSPK